MPDFALRTLGDQLVNGLVIGNIYALIAIGLALIFGVANLINFAHGSVYMVGAYVGWVAITWLGWPLLPTFVLVAVVCAGLGLAIERFGLRQLQNQARIAPLLATIGISFALDQLVQIVFSPNPHAFPSPLPATRIALGGVSVGLLDLLIAGITIAAALRCSPFCASPAWVGPCAPRLRIARRPSKWGWMWTRSTRSPSPSPRCWAASAAC
jgi:branched-chain amino acid transport system permease protein